MEFREYKAEWLDALKLHEDVLRLEKISSDDALAIGGIMVRLAKEKYRQPIAIRIISAGMTVYSHLMDGTSHYNDWWMDKKINVCRMTGGSSIRALVEAATGAIAMEPEFENEDSHALCGGGFPVRNAAGKLVGYVLCSGMKHYNDHQLIVDALSEFTGRSVPAIEY